MVRILALSFGLGTALTFAASAHAAALSGSSAFAGIKAPGIAQNVQYRRCWYDDGRRVCRYVYGYRDYDRRWSDRDDRFRWWRWRDRDRHFRRDRD
jgi:hypothetical protein